MRSRSKWICALIFCGSVFSAMAKDIVLETSSSQVRLLELFSSEGCSSCPPAESWFSNLQNSDELWKSIVPVCFHVTYWDYLGWTDRFARPEYTQRQEQYAALWNSGSVYTPAFVVNGEEWRGWFRGQTLAGSDPSSPGKLTVRINGDQVAVQFAASQKDSYKLYLAPLGMNLSSKVGAGENSGHHLRHDFVALGLESSDLQPAEGKWVTTLKVNWQDAKAVAVWVTHGGKLTPIQAVGGFL
jgi:hypothetical protein